MFSVIKLAEHGHPTLDPVLRAPARGQRHGNHIIGGVSCGREGALPLAGFVERTDKQLVRLITGLHLGCKRKKNVKKQWKWKAESQERMHLIFLYIWQCTKYNSYLVLSRWWASRQTRLWGAAHLKLHWWQGDNQYIKQHDVAPPFITTLKQCQNNWYSVL